MRKYSVAFVVSAIVGAAAFAGLRPAVAQTAMHVHAHACVGVPTLVGGLWVYGPASVMPNRIVNTGSSQVLLSCPVQALSGTGMHYEGTKSVYAYVNDPSTAVQVRAQACITAYDSSAVRCSGSSATTAAQTGIRKTTGTIYFPSSYYYGYGFPYVLVTLPALPAGVDPNSGAALHGVGLDF
jgi:hypothetical protein